MPNHIEFSGGRKRRRGRQLKDLGAPSASTISNTLVDDRTFMFIVIADGKTSFTGAHTMAADGKSFTNTYKTNGRGEPSSAAHVYEKQ